MAVKLIKILQDPQVPFESPNYVERNMNLLVKFFIEHFVVSLQHRFICETDVKMFNKERAMARRQSQ